MSDDGEVWLKKEGWWWRREHRVDETPTLRPMSELPAVLARMNGNGHHPREHTRRALPKDGAGAAVLAAITANPGSTAKELAVITGRTESSVRAVQLRLRKARRAYGVGAKGNEAAAWYVGEAPT
jgi:hypothetical protein